MYKHHNFHFLSFTIYNFINTLKATFFSIIHLVTKSEMIEFI